MKAICAACGRQYEVSAEGPPGNCISCGGQLKPPIEEPRVVDVPPVATSSAALPERGPAGQPANAGPVQGGPIDLAGESAAAGITCPNCGKWIEPGAQICTACGYSRRLARTLTTRVGTPEVLKITSRGADGSAPEGREIEAEKRYRREKARQRNAGADAIRLLVATLWLLALGAMVMAAPTQWLAQNLPLKLPGLLLPPQFDALNASLMMLMFLGVALPITAIGVRIAAAVANIETSAYFRWLRTAGVLAAMLVTMEIVFTVDQHFLHLQTHWLIAALALDAGVALMVFTWYLHDLSCSAAIVLALATLISAAVGLFAAAAAFGWLGNFLGIGPVIKPLTTWTWPKLG